jgi:predicted O-methyltransferase YrrM
VSISGILRKFFRETQIASADSCAKGVVLQCVLARAVKPEVILETGVPDGVSTSYLLHALK